MAKSASKKGKSPNEKRLDRMREAIGVAQALMYGTVLGPLLEAVAIQVCEGKTGEPTPQFACVDTAQGIVFLNPHVSASNERTATEWQYILAHELLHLALNHGARAALMETVPWNMACDCAADNLLRSLQIGTPPLDCAPLPGFGSRDEDEIYEALLLDPESVPEFRTFAGPGRLDMVQTKFEAPEHPFPIHGKRPDYQMLFAHGIRQAVERAVDQAANIQVSDRPERWAPGEHAKQWVMKNIPLLGALAAQIRIIADANVCDRMDISIAAVNGSLGEMYFRPDRLLAPAEMLFVYVHELLHVALLHGSRLQGRDALVWNYACDFVINGWLIEMGIGRIPLTGLLYDPRLQGMSAEEVYDLLIGDKKRCRGLRGLRGKLGDILYNQGRWTIRRDDVTTMDDMVRRCMAAGLACEAMSRGTVPAGLLEEIRSLFTPPVPWDVELARWMDAYVPMLRDPLRTYARASRRQSSTPDIPRPARYIPQEWKDACTFGVIMDTSGSMDRETLGHALGAVASYSEARDVPAVRLVMCDAAPYDRGTVIPTELRGIYPVLGRGGTVLQPAVNFLLACGDFPASAPIMIITDGWCEEELIVPRDHCFVLPRKTWKEGAMPLRTNAPVFRVLKPEQV